MAAEQRIARFSAQFTDAATERAFRARSFADARAQNRITIAVGAVLMAVHVLADHAANGLGPLFQFHATLRAVAVLACLVGIWLAGKRHNIALADGGVFFAQIVATTAFMIIVTTQRPEVMAERLSVQSMTAIFLVLAHYVFIATRLRLNLAAAVYTSALYFAASAAAGRLGTEALIMEGAMHVAVNLLGFWSAARYQRLRRRQFLSQRRQAATNQQLRATARALERARDEAILANRTKTQFLAHMSHELRSPLNAIIGFAEIMKERLFGPIQPERYGEYVGDIHTSASHLLAVINDMLDLSKAEAGRMEVREGTVDLRKVLDVAMRLVRERATAGEVGIGTSVPEPLPPVRGDERMIKQMVLNLLTNAVKYTLPGGTVTVEAVRAPDGAVSLHVSDTGVGIPPEEIPRILEAYGQADVARSRTVEGTGLGLPLVKTMIELHGGKLEVHSEPGEGSTFILHFPAERTVQAAA